jgi:hypothetical protein
LNRSRFVVSRLAMMACMAGIFSIGGDPIASLRRRKDPQPVLTGRAPKPAIQSNWIKV